MSNFKDGSKKFLTVFLKGLIHFFRTLGKVIVPINSEGNFIICIAVLISILAMFISSFLAWIAIILTCFIIYFFRDPKRIIPDDNNVIVAAADGVVDNIEIVEAPKELGLEGSFQRVSIFLNVFNVHIQRSPCSGKIVKSVYICGKFFNISNDKYHEDNERQLYLMKTTNGFDIAFVQIAGFVARRIVPFVKEGDELKIGDKFGCIKFGSRVDVYLPLNVKIKVKIGQTMIAGETVVGIIN